MKDFNHLNEWIPEKLKEVGITLEQLANRANISRTAIYRWLYDADRPTEDSIIVVCRVLGVAPEEGMAQYVPKRVGRPPERDDHKSRKKGRK
jgi:transcriptional regulator with XRE-family HTH domain